MNTPWYELSREEFSKGDLPTLEGTEKMMMEWVQQQVKELAEAKPDGFELTLDPAYIKKRYNTSNLELLMEFNKDGIDVKITDREIKLSFGTTLRQRIDDIKEYQRKRREQQERERRGGDS